MKKLTAFMLAALIIITPLYSYAVLPIIATAASAAGRILAGNAVRKPVGTAVRRGSLPCISSIGAAMSCASLGIGLLDLLRDKGYTVEEGDTINNNINIEIYKIETSVSCKLKKEWSYDANSYHSSYQSAASQYFSDKSDSNQTYSALPETYQAFTVYESQFDAEFANKILQPHSRRLYGNVSSKIKYVSSSITTTTNLGLGLYYSCLGSDESRKTYITQNELSAIIDNSINNLSADQRKQFYKNIYNYDFSQHPNITINNNSTSGDSVNNDIKNAPKEFEVSVDLVNKINNGQQDMDEINDENCDKNDQGQYDKCGDDRKPDDENDPKCQAGYKLEGEYCVKDDDPEKSEPPIECSANAFYKKVCDWMDWTKQPHNNPTDTKVFVDDKTSDIVIDDSRIDFDDQCPAPKEVSVVVSGHSATDFLDYQPMCDFFTTLKPFVVGILGAIPSAMIILGGVRRG